MSIGILGNKIGMTQIFDKKGEIIPVTVIQSGPCYITQIKSNENCGYNAIQLGYKEMKPSHRKIKKPNLGHFMKSGLPPFQYVKEYRTNQIEKYEVGQQLSIKLFEIGQQINITGLTIGKGNTSNIKRNNFGRGPMSHGSKHHRLQGSLGAGSTPGRVFPGKKMPGRVGTTKCTIKNLEIIDINTSKNLIVVRGCVPGKAGNLISMNIN